MPKRKKSNGRNGQRPNPLQQVMAALHFVRADLKKELAQRKAQQCRRRQKGGTAVAAKERDVDERSLVGFVLNTSYDALRQGTVSRV